MDTELIGHITVFLITADNYHEYAANVELRYAQIRQRARCYAVYDDTRSKNVQNYDPPVFDALAKALAETCDAVVVTGYRVTKQMLGSIQFCANAGKKIYAAPSVRSLVEKCIAEGEIKDVVLCDSLEESIPLIM